MTEDPARHDNPWSFWTYWRTKIKEDPEATDKSVNEQLDNEKPNWSNDPESPEIKSRSLALCNIQRPPVGPWLPFCVASDADGSLPFVQTGRVASRSPCW